MLGVNPKMNIRTRRNELVEMGLIIPTGIKRKSEVLGVVIGRTANVWVHAQYSGCFPSASALEAKCGRRLAFAKAAEELGRELKRLARELRTTNDSSWAIAKRLAHYRLSNEFTRAEYEYQMKEDTPRARE